MSGGAEHFTQDLVDVIVADCIDVTAEVTPTVAGTADVEARIVVAVDVVSVDVVAGEVIGKTEGVVDVEAVTGMVVVVVVLETAVVVALVGLTSAVGHGRIVMFRWFCFDARGLVLHSGVSQH